jgi:hypothetical protein
MQVINFNCNRRKIPSTRVGLVVAAAVRLRVLRSLACALCVMLLSQPLAEPPEIGGLLNADELAHGTRSALE